jgi:hypothetical protein
VLNFNPWDITTLKQHSVDLRQFIDFRQSTLPNGMRIVEAYNGSGLTFSILPDRGLDIWTAHYKGIPLTWISQGSPHAPDSGARWLRQFNGGLLTTCGLTHVGPPETDDLTGEWRDIHGLYSRLRSGDVSVRFEESGGEFYAELTSTVCEIILFGEQLRLTRTYRLTLGQPHIEIFDTVANLGDQPVPFMILYHVNVGYPLVSAGAKLFTPDAAVHPRDDAARPGFGMWPDYEAASPRYDEQVFYHHVKQADNMALAALVHDSFGFVVEWDTRRLPYLCQWKNTRQGIYVNGIEPANCVPEGRNAARNNNRLVMLEAGESHEFYCRLAVLDGVEAVEACKARIAGLQRNGTPVTGCNLDDYAR